MASQPGRKTPPPQTKEGWAITATPQFRCMAIAGGPAFAIAGFQAADNVFPLTTWRQSPPTVQVASTIAEPKVSVLIELPVSRHDVIASNQGNRGPPPTALTKAKSTVPGHQQHEHARAAPHTAQRCQVSWKWLSRTVSGQSRFRCSYHACAGKAGLDLGEGAIDGIACNISGHCSLSPREDQHLPRWDPAVPRLMARAPKSFRSSSPAPPHLSNYHPAVWGFWRPTSFFEFSGTLRSRPHPPTKVVS